MHQRSEVTRISHQGLRSILNALSPETPPGEHTLWTTDFKDELPLRLASSGPGSEPPITVSEAFTRTATNKPTYPALSTKKNGRWITKTYKEYYGDCINFGKALMKVGIPEYSTLNIIGFNSPQWSISFMGSILGNYLPIGIYTTNGPEACAYIAKHSECRVVVVENQAHLDKYMKILGDIPLVQYFVLYDGRVPSNLPEALENRVFEWNAFLEMGDKFLAVKTEDDIKYRIQVQKPGKCCTFIYTSGTTGTPKAVMLSHDNYTWLCLGLETLFDFEDGKERVMSLLPLSHVAAQLTDIVAPAYSGVHVFFVDASALQGNLTSFLQEIRPTIFMTVPRLWEKIFDKLNLMIQTSTGIKKKMLDWARSIGNKGTLAELNGRSTPVGWIIAKQIFYNKIKATLGIDQCKLLVVSAAPLQPSTREFFMDLNIPLVNCFGMSEVSGPQTFTNFTKWTQFDKSFFGEAGEPMPGLEVVIDKPDSDGNGEICMRGRNRFMGYYKDKAETIKCIDSQGFLRTGDLGRLDSNGTLYITGRLKELLITAGGQNVSPVLIEQEISKELPELAHVIVIGEQKKYLSALLVVKTENGVLSEDVQHVLKEIGSQAKTLPQVIACPLYNKRVQQGIDQSNSRSISKAQLVIKYSLLNDVFSIANGVLTPTLKVKRKQVNKKFQGEIESMYSSPKM